MAFSSFIKNQSTKIYNKFSEKPGDLLLWTGTIGWALSSAAHIFSIAINNKVDKEQKKFMVPQELADAAVNITSFFILTKSATDFGEFLVKKGKLVTPKIKKFIENTDLKDKLVQGKFTIHDSEYIDETNKAKFNGDFKNEYFNLFDGVSFIASTIGSIISSNIITPILRNKFAAGRQKQSIAEDKMKNEQILPTSPVLPAQNRFGIDDYKSKVMNTPRVISGGGMRV